MNDAENLLSVQETAKRFDISVITIRRWIKEGKLQAVKLGRQWRIRDSEIRKIIANGIT